jgi:hypothetical protein
MRDLRHAATAVLRSRVVGLQLLAALAVVSGCSDDAGAPLDGQTAMLVASTSDGSPASAVELPETRVGQVSTVVVRVTNTGAVASGPIALSIAGTAANDFGLDNELTTCAALPLSPSESCDVVVTFRPVLEGNRSAELAIVASAGGMATVALDGKGIVFDLQLTPNVVDFATIEVGTTAHATVALRNTGTHAAALDMISISGEAFSLGTPTCGTVLVAGQSCDIPLSTAPASLGSLTGTLKVTSEGFDITAQLATSGARRITIVRQGTGSGTVSSTPAGLDFCTTWYG